MSRGIAGLGVLIAAALIAALLLVTGGVLRLGGGSGAHAPTTARVPDGPVVRERSGVAASAAFGDARNAVRAAAPDENGAAGSAAIAEGPLAHESVDIVPPTPAEAWTSKPQAEPARGRDTGLVFSRPIDSAKP